MADGVNRVLSAVMEPGGTGGRLNFGRWDLAGKTGTIQENKAVWYAGYAPNLAAAAVVADANLPYTNLMHRHTLDGRDISDPTGSGTAGPLWQTAMQGALKSMPLERFVAPSKSVIEGSAKYRQPDPPKPAVATPAVAKPAEPRPAEPQPTQPPPTKPKPTKPPPTPPRR